MGCGKDEFKITQLYVPDVNSKQVKFMLVIPSYIKMALDVPVVNPFCIILLVDPLLVANVILNVLLVIKLEIIPKAVAVINGNIIFIAPVFRIIMCSSSGNVSVVVAVPVIVLTLLYNFVDRNVKLFDIVVSPIIFAP